MIRNSGNADKVLWSELLPHEFKSRQSKCPIVYLPLGLCEPHGQIAAFGLDTLKAEWLCEQAARGAGGIVAPSLGYHIHESGYHARWLEEEVGEENPHMTAMPPHIFLPFFLYQLRAFANAGFLGIIVISGHSGGNQHDLRMAAKLFENKTSVHVWVFSDPELVEGQFNGDHAGKYEISQLQHIRPNLVDFSKFSLSQLKGNGGPLAIAVDALEATAAYGRLIMEACLRSVINLSSEMKALLNQNKRQFNLNLNYDFMDDLCKEMLLEKANWATAKPRDGQTPVSPSSRWKPYEQV